MLGVLKVCLGDFVRAQGVELHASSRALELPLRDLADKLGIDIKTLKALIRDGKFRGIRCPADRVSTTEDAIHEFIFRKGQR